MHRFVCVWKPYDAIPGAWLTECVAIWIPDNRGRALNKTYRYCLFCGNMLEVDPISDYGTVVVVQEKPLDTP